MNRPLLSICMPTYNFGEFIGQTLESIVNQLDERADIIVVDGASTDNTVEVVKNYQRKCPRLYLHILDKKGGIDNDIAHTVNLAKGKYCWLMSSDDAIKQGALKKVMQELTLGHDIYLCNRVACDKNLSPVKEELWLSKSVQSRVFNFKNNSDLIFYLNKARSLGALFSYMSSIIFNKRKWDEIADVKIFLGSNYAHAYRLLLLAKKGASLKYIRESLLLTRYGNDSFLNEGVRKRFLIDFHAYKLLADISFNDRDTNNVFRNIMQKEHKWYMMPGLRSKIGDIQEWNEIKNYLIYYGYGNLKIAIIETLGTSNNIMKLLRFLWRIKLRLL